MLDYFISPIWLWQDRSWALCRVFSGAGCLVQTPRSPDLGILFTVYPRKMVPVIGALPIAEGRRQEPMPGDYTAGDSFSTPLATPWVVASQILNVSPKTSHGATTDVGRTQLEIQHQSSPTPRPDCYTGLMSDVFPVSGTQAFKAAFIWSDTFWR